MNQPHYAIEISKNRGTGCLDCDQLTSLVTGTRNGTPICDVCLLEQEPRLGALLAIHACIGTLADASKPRRAAQARVFDIVCEHGENLGAWFERGWRSALDQEMRLVTRYDLGDLRARARALGGAISAGKLEDLDWVQDTIREAKQRRVGVKSFLLIAALEQAGKQVGPAERQAIEEGLDRP